MNSGSDQKKIIIVGAGVSGLTAAIFGQKNNFSTEIFEKNPVAGGLCRCWTRNGYKIDGCIHWLTGTKQGTPLRNLWDELGAFSDDEIINDDNFGSIEIAGKTITFWADLEKFRAELLEISPQDKRRINKTISFIKKFQNMHLPVEVPLSLMKIRDFLTVGKDMALLLPAYLKCTNMMSHSNAEKFKSSILKEALKHIIPDNTNLYSALYSYGSFASGNGAVLANGSDTLVNNLVSSYYEKGGKIHFNSDIKQVMMDGKKAIGIELNNGDKYYADYVVLATDPFNGKKLVEEEQNFKFFEKHLSDTKNYPVPYCVLLTFAVDKKALDSLNLTKIYTFKTDEFLVGKSKINCIKLRDYSYDSNFIKDEKTVLQVMISQKDTDYEFWNSFENKEEYNNAKMQIAHVVLEKITEKFPVLSEKIEIIDVCTQKTFERYTRSYHGSIQPFIWTAKGKMLNHNGKIGNIENLYISSQWGITPGGLPIAMLSGKFTIQRILKCEGRNFRITKRIKFKAY